MKRYPAWAMLVGILSLLSGCGKEPSYHQKNGQWHYHGVPVDAGPWPVNFKPLDDYFARDDHRGYYRGAEVLVNGRSSDGPSFEALSQHYAKDRSAVYFCDTARDAREYWSVKRIRIRAVADADPVSFRLLGDGATARDKRHVFHQDRIVPVRDVETYQPLDNGFARDKVRGYYGLAEIAGSDGISFRVLESGYATDRARAYYRGAVLPAKDAQSLQVFPGTGYAKTSQQVFLYGELLHDADAASFLAQETSNGQFDARDRSGMFLNGERVKSLP